MLFKIGRLQDMLRDQPPVYQAAIRKRIEVLSSSLDNNLMKSEEDPGGDSAEDPGGDSGEDPGGDSAEYTDEESESESSDSDSNTHLNFHPKLCREVDADPWGKIPKQFWPAEFGRWAAYGLSLYAWNVLCYVGAPPILFNTLYLAAHFWLLK